MVEMGLLADILDSLDVAGAASSSEVVFTRSDVLPSCYAVTGLAAASIASVGVALQTLAGSTGPVQVDRRLASLWFGWSIRPSGWAMPSPWDALAGDYQTGGGWIKLHTNGPRGCGSGRCQLGWRRAGIGHCCCRWLRGCLAQSQQLGAPCPGQADCGGTAG
jgi:hypothetical protein